MDGKSRDIKRTQLEKLKTLFPETISEGKVDWEKLKATLGEDISFSNERYVLNWAGKGEAFKVLQAPTTATLAPAKEESVNFDDTGHIFIEGENLEVLKVLQKSYYGKVKMIYIDPPYNTGNDHFIYPDRFSENKVDYLKRVGEKDEEGYLTREGMYRKNSRDSGHYHSNWLNMMYPRLFLARNLLKEDGVIFVSIDDNEVHNLRLLMNEIFGEENFIANIVWEKRYTRSNDAKLMASLVEHILLYRKSDRLIELREPRTEKADSIYTNPDNDPNGSWTSVSYVSQRTKDQRPNLCYEVVNPITGEKVVHPTNAWKFSKKQYEIHAKEGKLFWGKDGGHTYPRLKKYISEVKNKGMVPVNMWHYKETGTVDDGTKEVDSLIGKDFFDYPKPTSLINRMMELACVEENEIILDFFSGSASTAHSVLKLNKEKRTNHKFICIQLPEEINERSEAYKAGYITIADIAKERIRRVIKKIEREEEAKKKEKAEKLDFGDEKEVRELDLGFKVFKLQSSNFKIWDGSGFQNGEQLAKQLEAFTDPVKEGAEEENMLYELLLKSGYDLNSSIERKGDFYVVNDGQMVLSLNRMTDDVVKEIISLKPGKCIALDRLFAGNDQLKTNTVLQMRDAGVEFKTI